MKVLFSHTTGNASCRVCLDGLSEEGILGEFWTTFACNPDRPVYSLLPESLRRQILRRLYPHHVLRHARYTPGPEMLRMILAYLLPRWLGHAAMYSRLMDLRNRLFDARVADRVRKGPENGINLVFCPEDVALETFRAARERGWKCFYDLPIGYWREARRILNEEAALRPEWAITMEGIFDLPEKLARKDQEIALADGILVASQFTEMTLKFFPGKLPRVFRIPYSAPVPVVQRRSRAGKNGPLKVIYIGSLTQRKGISYFFSAVERLGKDVEATVIGVKTGGACPALDQALKKCRWYPTVPHREVLKILEDQDVLVFPSLFEGFGFVLLEAMSRGVPVITTAHTGGPDIFQDGVEGFLIPIRSSEAIVEKLDALNRDRTLLEFMSGNAWNTAGKMSWNAYKEAVVEATRACSVE